VSYTAYDLVKYKEEDQRQAKRRSLVTAPSGSEKKPFDPLAMREKRAKSAEVQASK